VAAGLSLFSRALVTLSRLSPAPGALVLLFTYAIYLPGVLPLVTRFNVYGGWVPGWVAHGVKTESLAVHDKHQRSNSRRVTQATAD
jgi:hypothetical protein